MNLKLEKYGKNIDIFPKKTTSPMAKSQRMGGVGANHSFKNTYFLEGGRIHAITKGSSECFNSAKRY